MRDREEVLQTLKKLISEMFEIEPDEITPSASFKDLDLDSIDAVDLMVKLREITGRRIQPEDFKNARTIQDVVETIHKMYHL
ncbi:acyl carrier protein [Methylomagnum sp.]